MLPGIPYTTIPEVLRKARMFLPEYNDGISDADWNDIITEATRRTQSKLAGCADQSAFTAANLPQLVRDMAALYAVDLAINYYTLSSLGGGSPEGALDRFKAQRKAVFKLIFGGNAIFADTLQPVPMLNRVTRTAKSNPPETTQTKIECIKAGREVNNCFPLA